MSFSRLRPPRQPYSIPSEHTNGIAFGDKTHLPDIEKSKILLNTKLQDLKEKPEKHKVFIDEEESFGDALKRLRKEKHNEESFGDAIERLKTQNWQPFEKNTEDYELNSLKKEVESIHNSKSGGKKKTSRRKKHKMRKSRKNHKKIQSNKNRK